MAQMLGRRDESPVFAGEEFSAPLPILSDNFSGVVWDEAAPPFRLPAWVVRGTVMLGDGLMILSGALAAGWLHACLAGACEAPGPYLGLMVAVAVLAVLAFAHACDYEPETVELGEWRLGAKIAILALAIGLGAAGWVLVGPPITVAWDRATTWSVTTIMLAVGLISVWRMLARACLTRLGDAHIRKRVVALIGTAEQLDAVTGRLPISIHRWNRIISIVFDPELPDADAQARSLINHIADLLLKVKLKEVIIVPPRRCVATVSALIRELGELALGVLVAHGHIAIEQNRLRAPWTLGLKTVVAVKQPLSDIGFVFKRALDLVLGSLFLLLLAPLLLLIAVCIRLDSPGQALFRQTRIGYKGQPFTIHKFRTMYRAEADAQGGRQATRNDPRVTQVGRFLRSTSLDELPQLFDVIRGTMSLVGPRPHAVDHDRDFAGRIASYRARQKVRPGLTGWAQVNGYRGETSNEHSILIRLRHDLSYIENWSVWFDLEILLMTIRIVVTRSNAY